MKLYFSGDLLYSVLLFFAFIYASFSATGVSIFVLNLIMVLWILDAVVYLAIKVKNFKDTAYRDSMEGDLLAVLFPLFIWLAIILPLCINMHLFVYFFILSWVGLICSIIYVYFFE